MTYRQIGHTPNSESRHHPKTASTSRDTEKGVNGALLQDPNLCAPQIGDLASWHFLSSDNRKIFTTIQKLIGKGGTANAYSVIAELGESVPVGYVAECMIGVVPERFSHYKGRVMKLRRIANSRRSMSFENRSHAGGTIADSTRDDSGNGGKRRGERLAEIVPHSSGT